ncbi:Asp-tRNA(Asn)/Glu-tRNA(Gln) amidotransferase subunit GatC [Erysipelothrix tonsillarum]|uniref:Asp-tRNA(Asn)/Glu-tRNA(Gln) amidotransferase subunit GatC n=1 Tax=Erysipelothrix tonsillarum TaxID=38402 RepID=UPI00036BFE64|nr:Asp-tRNA(Asn)/Glu-tRNA(Gln) amidotransferase subunit GatC [Erysipelothrix tonsillarum]
MKNLDKELIEKFASDLMFRLTDEELEMVAANAPVFERYVNKIQGIDTQGVEVMSYPFEMETTWLREDEPDHVIDQALAFENAPRVDGDYFEIVKVVNK